MNDAQVPQGRSRRLSWGVLILAMILTAGLALLLSSIIERRQEAQIVQIMQPIDPMETDSAKWAGNFPRQYDRYKRMQDSETQTKYGGAFLRDYLEETPANVILFSGYGFAKDYLQGRGHVYAVEDVKHSKRVGAKTPATCWHCKSPDVPRVMAELGKEKVDYPDEATFQELIMAGAGDFYKQNFMALKDEITHPIGCFDCHDPATMALRITRPALIEAFERQGRDINQASHQEMRTLVCAQCHVEYYFKGEGKYLTFPWDKGLKVEQMEEYYDQYRFADWTHAISGTPMIKMQHPDYEIYNTGIHAYRGVSCADCHMPYRTEGGAKFTDHHLRSPMLNIENSCAVCHRWGEQEIRQRVEGIQDKVREARTRAESAIALAHFDIAACKQAGAEQEKLKAVRQLVRSAQVRWDYVAANNGMGSHSPQECVRVLLAATDLAQQARIESTRLLAQLGHTDPVRYPDYSTKEKAQALSKAFIAGNPPNLLGEKAEAVAGR